ncbi:MAG: hypothetical protein CME93_06630 [Hyphomonadaceae bacterium]|nr:hypothetical protein [Hyphomonadaceae bacterium]OUX93866.1 MAG: hypothetical protein CBB77_08105 [Hyphomonas sp. TMED17]
MSATTSERIAEAQQALQQGKFEVAEQLISNLLETAREQQDVVYMSAVCARYLGKYSDAENTLGKLKQLAPEFGRAYQEEGYLMKASDRPDDAIAAFQLATRYNPALIAAWKTLSDLYKTKGRNADAHQAQAQADRMQTLPPPLLAVMNHIHEGRILRAEEIARAFLQKHPRHIEGMRLLADIGSRLSVHEDAEFLLATAIELAPDNIQLRIDYIQVLRKRQKFALALEQAETLLERDPESPVFQSLFAIESMQAGNYEAALNSFDNVLKKLPDDPATLTSRGHALKTCGRSNDAVASYQKALAADPKHGDAWYALANLKTHHFSDADIKSMQATQSNEQLPLMSRIHIAFALGKAFEDAGAYDQAFENYARGNQLKKSQTRYTSSQMTAELDAQKQYCTRELFASNAGHGHAAADPIFIVGLPRAGSTLLEQILSSHSQVDGTLELPNILSLAHRLLGRNLQSDKHRYPRILGELDPQQLDDLGRNYIDGTMIHRQGAAFFTDKMPNNFRHIGLIHLILPNAKIIDARRNPMDCCWSGFKQLFAEGQEFSYGLEDIGTYYRNYVDMMAHWHAVLPENRILHVQHEDVLDDLEGEVRRILDYCGLPFEENCLNFHENKRAVRTASSEQVRRPVNKSGLEQWRPFEANLQPLIDALGLETLAFERSNNVKKV